MEAAELVLGGSTGSTREGAVTERGRSAIAIRINGLTSSTTTLACCDVSTITWSCSNLHRNYARSALSMSILANKRVSVISSEVSHAACVWLADFAALRPLKRDLVRYAAERSVKVNDEPRRNAVENG